MGLPQWLSRSRILLQCRRHRSHGFDPWVRKIPQKRIWQSTPVLLPEKSHGQWSLAVYSSWGHKESDTTEQLSTATTQGQLIFHKEAKNAPWREDSLFNKQCSGNWRIICERIKSDPYITPYTKFNWKWIRGLNVQYKAVELLKENIEQYSLAPVGNSFFFNMTTKVQIAKAK